MIHHEHARPTHDHTKVYLAVFVALLVLTGATVGVSKLDLPRWMAIFVGLSIAFIKGGLVVAYFMHLVSEKTIIRSVLGLSAIALFFLILLPWIDIIDTVGESTQTAAVEMHPSASTEQGAAHEP